MNFPAVQIIVLQYNNSADTLDCLNSLNKSDYPNYKVLVVDNKSSAEHVVKIKKIISEMGKNYSLLLCEANLGYSGGNNAGIYRSLKETEFIFILNNDTIIQKETLSYLVRTAQANSSIGVIAPALNEERRISYGGKIIWLRSRLDHIYSSKELEHSQKRFYIPGTAMLIRKQVFDKIGFFDKRYFLYFEDADFSLRVVEAGFKLLICPDISIIHKSSNTTRHLGSPALLGYHYRNAHLFNWKFAPYWAKLLLPFWSIFIIIKQMIKIILLPSKRDDSRFILLGVVNFYLNRFGKLND